MRTDVLSTNFSAGEWSPRLHGRPDLQKYADAVKLGRNVVFLQHGGFRNRPGTDYLGVAKEALKYTRLVPFVYSVTDSYVLEFGDLYMRVWKRGEQIESSPGVPYEIATPYTVDDLPDLDYTQGADTMFIALQRLQIRRLRRFADDRWVLDVAPMKPAPYSDIGSRHAAQVTLGSAALGATTATAASSTWLASDVGRVISYNGGTATITGLTSALIVDVNVTAVFTTATLPASEWVLLGSPQTTCAPTAEGPVGTITQLTLGAAGWRSADVGDYVSLNGGVFQIKSYSSTTVVNALIKQEAVGTSAAEADSWAIERAVWNFYDGYPGTVTLHQQRLVAAGSPAYPQTIWGSRVGLYLDFTRGESDDDSYSHILASDEINPIQFLSSNRDLIALTYGGEWTLNGGLEKPITWNNIRATMQAKVGCNKVRPEQIDDDLYYAQRGGQVVRTVTWNVSIGGYQSGEASTFAEHLPRPGIDSITYQQSPERIGWITLADGTYIAMTASREQNVRAMGLCTLGAGGKAESMATVPEDDEDVTYVLVRRRVDGATVRYMERMNWEAYQDSRVVQTITTPTKTISDLDHLEGLEVSAVVDGVDVGTFTVTGGSITLLRNATTEVSVGARFLPEVQLLSAETGTGMGASLGMDRLTGRGAVLLQDTIGCQINGQNLAFRTMSEDVLDSPVAPYSGWKDVSEFGWRADSDQLTITQPQSYPIHVLAVRRRISVNPG